MAQKRRALAILAEDPASIPRTTTIYNSSSRGSVAFFYPPSSPGTAVMQGHKCRQNVHTHKTHVNDFV